jgi:FdhE protein
MSAKSGDARIARAGELAAKFPFATEVLNFYASVARLQKELAAQYASKSAPPLGRNFGAALRHLLEPAALLPQFPRFLAQVAAIAPPPLAAFASELAGKPAGEMQRSLAAYWEKGCRFEPGLDEPATFCARAFLQPYAESLADAIELPPPSISRGSCPLCDGLPQLGILRPEGDGARRSLLCAFCGAEWEYRRILCPSCGEEDEKKLCVYAAKEFDYLRVEACDSCKTYIVTVDLSKDGRAVPVVDELAALPLSLWAGEQGYTKVQRNVLGM